MEKYKCVYFNGCDFSTTINGKELVIFSEYEINAILKPILCWFAENSKDEENLKSTYALFRQETDKFLEELDNLPKDSYYEMLDKTFEQFKAEYTMDGLKELINDNNDLASLQMLFEDFLTEFGEYEDFGFCEQCGSYNDEYTCTVEL